MIKSMFCTAVAIMAVVILVSGQEIVTIRPQLKAVVLEEYRS